MSSDKTSQPSSYCRLILLGHLLQESNIMFSEVSAYTGKNVIESLTGMAR